MRADPAEVQRLNTMRTRDKKRSLLPGDANESFYCDLTGEGHSSLAKFKESLKSSARTNHAAEVAPVDLEKQILLLSENFEKNTKVLLESFEEEKKKTKVLGESFEEEKKKTKVLEENLEKNTKVLLESFEEEKKDTKVLLESFEEEKKKTQVLLESFEEEKKDTKVLLESFEEEKKKTQVLLRQLEEQVAFCRREHQDPTLVNEAQKVRPLREIWARALSVGLDLQSDEEATAKSIKSKGDLDAHPLGLREAALTVYDVSRDASYPSNNLRLITRGFELLYGIGSEDALLLLFADKVMYFQEKAAFKIPRKSISFSILLTPNILCSPRDDGGVPRVPRMVYAHQGRHDLCSQETPEQCPLFRR